MNYLEANLKVLESANAGLAKLLRELPDDGCVQVEPSRDGAHTLSVTTDKAHFLHSKYRPLQEAQRFAGQHEVTVENDFILLGLGLGYHWLELAKKAFCVTRFVVVEPDLRVLKAALTHNDFTELLDPDRTMLLAGMKPAGFTAEFTNVVPFMAMNKIQIISHPASIQLRPDYYDAIQGEIKRGLTYATKTLQTSMTLTTHDIENRLANLPGYLAAPRLDSFKERFAGKPGILVAAGPSLQKNIHHLKRAKGKAVIFSVGTAVRRLLAEGIVPDFVATLDYSRLSKKYLENLPIPAGERPPVLLADPKCHAETVMAYQGPVMYVEEPRMNWLLGEFSESDARFFFSGATVAHMVYSALDYLGVETLITVGLDLSFAFGVNHVPGIATHDEWYSLINRFQSFDMLEWEQIVRFRKEMIRLTDVHGNPVYSDSQMVTYLQSFSKSFTLRKKPVIDATEGGCRKDGAQIKPLSDVLDEVATEDIADELFGVAATDFTAGTTKSIALLEKQLATMLEQRDTYAKTLDLNDAVQAGIEAGDNYQTQAQELTRLQRELESRPWLTALIGFFVASDEIIRRRMDRRIEGLKHTWDQKTTLLEHMKRDRHVNESHLAGVKQIIMHTAAALEAFKTSQRAAS